MASIYGQTVGGLLADAAGNVYQSVYDAGSYLAANPQTAGLLAGQMAPGAGSVDAAGYYPDPFQPNRRLPSLRENIRQGNYLDAGFQGLGLLGDAAIAVPPLAVALKAPRAARIAAMAPDTPVGTPPINTGGAVGSVNEPAGNYRQYLGAAPDRSGGSYERYVPARGVPENMQRIIDQTMDMDSPIVRQFDDFIAKGIQLDGADWYNTEELRDWFVSRLGEEQGNAEWLDFIDLIGATSTGSKVSDNMRLASFYRALDPDQRMAVAALVKEKGVRPRDAAAQLGIDIPNLPDDGFGYGHLKQRNHAANILNQGQGNWAKTPPEEYGEGSAARTKFLQANPKVKGFSNSLVGNVENIAADIHFMRMLVMADGSPEFLNQAATLSEANLNKIRKKYGKKTTDSYIASREKNGQTFSEINLAKMVKDGVITDTDLFSDIPQAWRDTPKPNEYAALEQMAQNIAARYDMTPAQFQASLWMGAGETTNLADESQGTAMQLFRNALDKRAKERGLTREEMLLDFIDNKGLLAVPATAAGGAVGLGLLSGQEQEGQF